MNNCLKGVEFSIWTADAIRKASVVSVTEKRTTDKGIPLKDGLRDPRMGRTSARTTAIAAGAYVE